MISSTYTKLKGSLLFFMLWNLFDKWVIRYTKSSVLLVTCEVIYFISQIDDKLILVCDTSSSWVKGETWSSGKVRFAFFLW